MEKDKRLKAIVTTTIYVPVSLEGYLENASHYDHKNLFLVIIGDKKTPDDEVRSFLAKLRKRYSYEIFYFSCQEQLEEFRKFKELLEHIPWNVIQRRNLGILYAFLKGAEVIITIDDDNFVTGNDDYIGLHSVVGQSVELEAYDSDSGWFNICRSLKAEHELPFYPRGYPMGKRWLERERIKTTRTRGKVVVNGGLWLGEPDIDAITRLHREIRVEKYNRKNNFILARGTWSPFNSQNTALERELIPAYFLSPNIGRYDDIWPSYIINAIADHLGDYLSFGLPLVSQKRNPHDYYENFEAEKVGMQLTDNFCEYLRRVEFSGKGYRECLRDVLTQKDTLLLEESRTEFRKFYEQFFAGLKIWNEIF